MKEMAKSQRSQAPMLDIKLGRKNLPTGQNSLLAPDFCHVPGPVMETLGTES